MIRRITREVRHREQGHDGGIELMRPDVPVRKLAVLARNKSVEERGCDQCICSGRARRILLEPVFKDPFVRVSVRPRIETFRALPIERLVVGDEYRRSPRSCSWKVANPPPSRPAPGANRRAAELGVGTR